MRLNSTEEECILRVFNTPVDSMSTADVKALFGRDSTPALGQCSGGNAPPSYTGRLERIGPSQWGCWEPMRPSNPNRNPNPMLRMPHTASVSTPMSCSEGWTPRLPHGRARGRATRMEPYFRRRLR